MKSAIAMTLIALLAAPAFAEQPQHIRKNVNARERHQDQRMKQGAQSGQLTREEMQQLKQERRTIRQEEKAYRSDGRLNKEERKDLQQDLNQMSKDIYQEKHDGDVRTPPAK